MQNLNYLKSKLKTRFLKLAIRLKILHDFTYFEQYFAVLSQIHHHKNTREKYKIQIFQLAILLQSVHMLVFAVFPDNFSLSENIAHFNLVALDQLPSYINYWYFLSLIQAVYFAQLFYLKNNGITAQIMKDVLLDGNNHFFLVSKSRHCGKDLLNCDMLWHIHRAKDFARIVQKSAVFIRNVLQVLYIFYSK